MSGELLARGRVLLLALLLLALNAGVVSARLGFLHKPHQVPELDHRHYLEMARGPAGEPELAGRSPYCYRVLVPALARLLGRAGLKLNPAFWLLTNLALLGFLLALERYLALLGFAERERLLGLVLVGLVQGCLRWHEVQYWMTDAAGLFLLVLALVLLERGGRAGLALVNLVAAFVRETQVVVYPCVFLQRLRTHGWGDALRTTLATSLPALAAAAALRRLIVPLSGPTLLDAIADNLDGRFRHFFDNQLYLMTFGTWGVLLVLALVEPRLALRLARRHPGPAALLVLVYVTTFLISNNNERPLAYAVVAVLPAALCGLRAFLAGSGLPFLPTALGLVALQLVVYQQTLFTGEAISVYQPTNWLVIVLLTAAWGAARLWLRAGRRKG